MKKVNDTETARAALPFVGAQSPVRYNLDELNWTEIPYTAPGQIGISVYAEYERQVLNPDREPLEPIFLNETDCPPGTPYGITFQNDEDSGELIVYRFKEVIIRQHQELYHLWIILNLQMHLME